MRKLLLPVFACKKVMGIMGYASFLEWSLPKIWKALTQLLQVQTAAYDTFHIPQLLLRVGDFTIERIYDYIYKEIVPFSNSRSAILLQGQGVDVSKSPPTETISSRRPFGVSSSQISHCERGQEKGTQHPTIDLPLCAIVILRGFIVNSVAGR